MKLIPILICSAIAASVLPACSLMPKKHEAKASCCSTTGKCDTAHKKHHN